MAKTIPTNGINHDKLLQELEEIKGSDIAHAKGKTWSLVYHASKEHTDFLKEVYTMFFSENGLNVLAFPSLKRFESEVIAMTANMLGGDADTCGTMTSGGTESILMAIKAYRQRARAEQPHITAPEMIVPISIHPAFEKAAHYFDVKAVHAPLRDDYRVDVDAVRELINDNTILIVGSAPNYPQGVIDPIEELAALAQEHGLGMHVDACLGGFCLPWVRKIGYDLPPFDFSVPGVTSMSADVHKYGFAAKGASTVLYRSKDIRKFQFFVYTEWPGGIYASPSMTGTRPGGSIAAAWAALNALGEDGYKEIATKIMNTARTLQDRINALEDLRVVGKPDMGVFAFTSDTMDILAAGDVLEDKGWAVDRQTQPDCLHLMVTPTHAEVIDEFMADLEESIATVKANPELSSSGKAAMYGMMAQIPDRGMVNEYILNFMDSLYEI